MSSRVGSPTIACRIICSALIASPLLYRGFVADGNAYYFLALVLLAPTAGFVLFANSLFCLVWYRSWKSASLSVIFISISVIGFLTARYYLPQFRM